MLTGFSLNCLGTNTVGQDTFLTVRRSPGLLQSDVWLLFDDGFGK